MTAWTPEAITNLVVQLIALATAVTAILAAIQKLRGDLQANTVTTNATSDKIDAMHTAVTATGAQVNDIATATLPQPAAPVPPAQ